MKEIEYAREHNVPMIVFNDVTDMVIDTIKEVITLEIGAENG